MTTQNIYPETKRRGIGLLPFIVAIVVPLLSAPLAGVQSEGELQETNGIFGFPIYPESWGGPSLARRDRAGYSGRADCVWRSAGSSESTMKAMDAAEHEVASGRSRPTPMLGLKIFLFALVTTFVYPVLFTRRALVIECPANGGDCITRYGDSLLPPLLGRFLLAAIVIVFVFKLWGRGRNEQHEGRDRAEDTARLGASSGGPCYSARDPVSDHRHLRALRRFTGVAALRAAGHRRGRGLA
jgi:hypothetical protein